MSMILLPDTSWDNSAITPTELNGNTDPLFPLANLLDVDPMLRWKASTYAAVKPVLIWDFGSAKSIGHFFLNQCNFGSVEIYAGSALGSLNLIGTYSLSKDSAGNRKIFQAITCNYRYFTVQIPTGQTLDDSDTVPAIGNVILGTGTALPPVSGFNKRVVQKQFRFQNDSGGTVAKRDGRKKHAISIDFGGALFTEVSGIISGWEHAVLFENMSRSQDAYLILEPELQDLNYRGYLHLDYKLNLDERV